MREKEGAPGIKARKAIHYTIMGLKEFAAAGEGANLAGKKLATKHVEEVKADVEMKDH